MHIFDKSLLNAIQNQDFNIENNLTFIFQIFSISSKFITNIKNAFVSNIIQNWKISVPFVLEWNKF